MEVAARLRVPRGRSIHDYPLRAGIRKASCGASAGTSMTVSNGCAAKPPAEAFACAACTVPAIPREKDAGKQRIRNSVA
jgi:hypothetical protein